jgi:biopolymer transport protein ExbD
MFESLKPTSLYGIYFLIAIILILSLTEIFQKQEINVLKAQKEEAQQKLNTVILTTNNATEKLKIQSLSEINKMNKAELNAKILDIKNKKDEEYLLKQKVPADCLMANGWAIERAKHLVDGW